MYKVLYDDTEIASLSLPIIPKRISVFSFPDDSKKEGEITL